MRILSQDDLVSALTYDRLVADLPLRLMEAVDSPQRHVHALAADASLLLMPAWSGKMGGVKIVNVTPANAKRGGPVVTASYLVFDADTGEHLALLDGGELTARRTAAVAAVAASRLSIDAAHRLLLVGSGRIATELAFAYRAVRDIREVEVFSPTRANAEKLAHRLRDNGFAARACEDLARAAASADIIACATLSHEPLILGEWLHAGQHVALIGGYLPDMREGDDDLMRRAAVWIDTEAALVEAGDLAGLRRADIRGALCDLCAVSAVDGQGSEITLFKSVGDAAQDLAAAGIALETH
ncbi:MAG: ornithine cyclodeaminase family protein [Asticcacaulis sp.]